VFYVSLPAVDIAGAHVVGNTNNVYFCLKEDLVSEFCRIPSTL